MLEFVRGGKEIRVKEGSSDEDYLQTDLF